MTRKFAIDCIELLAWEVTDGSAVDRSSCLIVETEMTEAAVQELTMTAGSEILLDATDRDDDLGGPIAPDRMYQKLSELSTEIRRSP